MKTNLFKVRKLEKEKILVEEEQLKHPILLFFKKHEQVLVLLLIILGVSAAGISLGLTISLVGNTGDFDITYTTGDEEINANPGTNDEEVEKELYGNIAITDGVVLVTKKFMTEKGDIVTYYSDGTSLIVTSKGEIKRVVPLADGNYAIDESGNINSEVIRKVVTSTTSTLKDGTIITYYSDGSSEITKDKITIFIRNSTNIAFDLTTINQMFSKVIPSGVSLPQTTTSHETYKYTTFFDGTLLIDNNGIKYLVHNDSDIKITESLYSFNNNNMTIVKTTSSLSDGNTIDYFTDGSAIITNSNNDKVFVRKSGDIVIKNNSIYEIVPADVYNAVNSITSPDGKKITYYDNGSAIIQKVDGSKEYIEENSNIKYDTNKNILSVSSDKIEQILQKKLPDGTVVTNFSNEKTQIIETNGRDYIIDTDNLTYDLTGNVESPTITTSSTIQSDGSGTITSSTITSGVSGSSTQTSATINNDNEEVDIDMSESDNQYNYSKSLENSSFTITNKNKHSRKFRLVIEEVSDYSKYNANSMETVEHEAAYYVKYQATIGSGFIHATRLSDNKINTSNNINTYTIYEGTLGAKSKVNVNIILYIDYAPLDNSFQNKAFIGTIRLYYIDDDTEE